MKKILIVLVVVLIVIIGAFFVFGDKRENTQTNPKLEENTQKVREDGYQGKLLAGTTSPYLEFKKEDYDKAVSEDKILFLDFYATWCPICRAEEPEILAGFNQLNNNNLVGFRVNFNDPDTDSSEKDLATKFNVPYQHTKLIIKNGNEVARFTDQWTKQDFINELNRVL